MQEFADKNGPGSPRWIALCREAAIAGQAISEGLTALRKANYAATGLYSHAFFNLSIGLERLLKIIVMLDYAIDNDDTFPTSDILKIRYGHNISMLCAHAANIAQRRKFDIKEYELPSDDIEAAMIKFLTEFALRSRYYNLDFLSQNPKGASVDPIADWIKSMGQVIVERHYSKRSSLRDTSNADAMQALFGSFVFVMHTSEEGYPLKDLRSGALQTGKNKIMQKYGTYYCTRLVRYFYSILFELESVCNQNKIYIPCLYEFFFPFLNDDRYLLSRKTFPVRG